MVSLGFFALFSAQSYLLLVSPSRWCLAATWSLNLRAFCSCRRLVCSSISLSWRVSSSGLSSSSFLSVSCRRLSQRLMFLLTFLIFFFTAALDIDAISVLNFSHVIWMFPGGALFAALVFGPVFVIAFSRSLASLPISFRRWGSSRA